MEFECNACPCKCKLKMNGNNCDIQKSRCIHPDKISNWVIKVFRNKHSDKISQNVKDYTEKGYKVK